MDQGERWRLVRRRRLCFNCLKGNHRSSVCHEQHECGNEHCTKRWHILLHERSGRERVRGVSHRQQSSRQASNHVAQQQQQAVQLQPVSPEGIQQVFTNTIPSNKASKLLFKIVPVILYANSREIKTYAFFDEGSAISLINRALATRLGLKGYSDSITLQWFGSTTVTEPSCRVDVEISGIERGSKKFNMRNVRTVSNLQLPMQSISLSDLHYKDQHLPLREYSGAVPELLIGLDNAYLGVPRRTAHDGSRGYAVVLTKLGWVIYGAGRRPLNQARYHTMFARVSEAGETSQLEDLIHDYIINESMGVGVVKQVIEAEDIVRAKKLLQENTKRNGNQFETCLLWKDDNIELPASREMAEKRFYALERKFKRDDDLKKAYATIIAGYVAKGYASKLSEEEAAVKGKRTWYLPHFAVYNPNKPAKIRLVFDAAAESEGVSLNSALLSGPDLLQPLGTVLMKFRQKQIGVCADIVEMFHQVKIRDEDLSSQRFLWRYDPEARLDEYVMNVMTFGATCSPCSAQFVKNKNADDFEEFPEAVAAIKNNHYVDDFVHCFSSEEDALRITSQVIRIHKKGGFELKRFVSNSEVISNLNKEPFSMPMLNLDRENAQLFQKVLGMSWNTEEDALKFVLSFGKVNRDVFNKERKPTKREVLSVAMSVFDPFGIAAEYSLEAKLILQAMWRERKGWDERVSDAVYENWRRWLEALRELEKITVPRCYGATFMLIPVELHVFSDASESAYAAVAYWRLQDECSNTRTCFIAGKTKCAPIKLVSVPRLELQSAVLAARLRQNVVNSHDKVPVKVVMWSDSKTVLAWIKSDHRRYKPYVAHRVNEILENSELDEWRWLPSALNPADFGTRPRDRKRESFWLTGPKFLKEEEKNWPPNVVCDATNVELRNKFTFLLIQIDTNFLKKFSCFLKLKRVVSWTLRFVKNCRTTEGMRAYGNLKVNELERAEMCIVRAVQMEAFLDEYHSLQAGDKIEKGSALWNLSPIMDDNGIMRIGGRIDAATMVPTWTRRPAILPNKCHVTEIIVDYFHRIWRHQNESTIIAEIRRKYWMPRIRTEVRRAAARCQVCLKEKAVPRPPQMGQLPADRLTPFVRPFTYTGLDYMGPFTITIGRRSEKRWIALFTCLTTRAIHLELAKDLTTDTCLMCLRNFMCRRGIPVRIRSDNGTNFVGADRELKRQLKEFNDGKIADALVNKNVEWVFNCPSNPHAGGCWERLVRSVKRAMGHALYNENLHEHSLYHLMCEAENIVNSRPLTHIPLDTATDEPLTPNHFLIGTPNSEQTPHPQEEKFQATRKQWRKVQQTQYRFWKKWVNEYLPDLVRRTKWYQPVELLAVGDLVLVCDSSQHRSRWLMGRLVKVFPGKDGQVRSAEVQTKTGTFKRPACILAKLELGKSG
ncbi:uncharacterized protein LOC118742367 [Rhagoletis pomonella]|nr:uncharacterized protein LOC118742367 [Rhagoletis pomonella]